MLISTARFVSFLLCFILAPVDNAGNTSEDPYVLILGIAQDAGYPHPACRKECCLPAWNNTSLRQLVTCLALIDPVSNERWMIEATPDFPHQLHILKTHSLVSETPMLPDEPLADGMGLSGILLTHSHIGHYTGLMYLGREGIGANRIPVFAMPRLARFLESNGPWSQLVTLENITVRTMAEDEEIRLSDRLSVTPFLVPHRDEYSEVVGFRIRGPRKTLLFIPDIDKWNRWDRNIEEEIQTVDYALIDGTFHADGEVPGRSMDEIPHPFVAESMKRFNMLPPDERDKIRFIHLNHTNPLLHSVSAERDTVLANGYHIAETGERLLL